MFLSFFHDYLQGVLRFALYRYYSSRWFAFVQFVLLRSIWPHVYVICVCLVFLSVGDLLVKKKWLIFATKAIFTAMFLHIVKWYKTPHDWLFCIKTSILLSLYFAKTCLIQGTPLYRKEHLWTFTDFKRDFNSVTQQNALVSWPNVLLRGNVWQAYVKLRQ